MKPEALRLRGWVIASVGFLFLVFSLLVSQVQSPTGGGSIAYEADLWSMAFWILMGMTGAVLVLVETLVVVAGYMAEYLKR